MSWCLLVSVRRGKKEEPAKLSDKSVSEIAGYLRLLPFFRLDKIGVIRVRFGQEFPQFRFDPLRSIIKTHPAAQIGQEPLVPQPEKGALRIPQAPFRIRRILQDAERSFPITLPFQSTG
jgi:hypothetical protein